MPRFSRRTVLTGAGSLALASTTLRAQEQTIKIIYPFPAGGSGDAIARMIADHLQKSLRRPVIVENKSGAAGRIGAHAVKDAPPDGTVLLFAAASQMTLQPHIPPNLGYDPFADFIPISRVVTFDVALVVSSTSPVRSIRELVAWLRANPDHAVYGSPGAGTGAHFAGMKFAKAFDLDLRHVAYRGTPAALPDVLTGRIPMYIAASTELLEHQTTGTIRILATAGATRSTILPDVPTFIENGIDIDATGWFAFYAPARTPAALVRRLETEIVTATHVPETHARILAMGFQPTGTSADELKQIQRDEFDRWALIVKASGYRAER